MDSNLLTIDNMMFAGTTVPAYNTFNINSIEKTSQPPLISDDSPSPSNTSASIKTDNTCPITLNEPVNKPQQDFSNTLRKTAATKTQSKDKDNIKSNEPETTTHTTVKPDIVQNWLAQDSQTIENGKEGNPTITGINLKNICKPAQLLNNLKADKSSPVTGQTAESAKIKLLVTTEKGQSESKTILSETSKGKPELQIVLSNTSESTPTGGTQPGQSKNINSKIPISNGTILPIKASINSQNSNEPVPNAFVYNNSKTTAADEKTTMIDTKVLTSDQKTHTSNISKLTQENPIDDDSKTTNTDKETAITDKSVLGSQKPLALSTNFPSVQAKSLKSQSQPMGIAPEKSAPITEKPSDSKVTFPHILSESSLSNNKESSQVGNKLSEILQKDLNFAEVNVSTGQTKDHSSSTSNNSFNSGLEQILPNNNPQTPTTEQSPISAESAKTTYTPTLSYPNDTSADIGKQILESIQSSLSQQRQDQQITVRLNPPELGKVLIKFQEQDEQITGLLEVSRAQTRIEIQQSLPQIIRSLQDSGIQIKRLDVVLPEGGQPQQGALKDQSLPDGWTQPNDSANPHSGANNSNSSRINELLTNNNSYQNISELQETLITEGSINMLV